MKLLDASVDGRGDLIGAFRGDDRLLIATQSGVINSNSRFKHALSEDMLVLEKWEPNKPISVIYFDQPKNAIWKTFYH